MATQLAVGNAGVVLGECSSQGVVPDLSWLEQELESNLSIRAVTHTNPGNPTGVSLDADVLQRVTDLCRQHNKWLILDCTYEHFEHSSLDNAVFPCFPDPHVIHIFSFSKGFLLAGYRCGYVVVAKEAGELLVSTDAQSPRHNPDLHISILTICSDGCLKCWPALGDRQGKDVDGMQRYNP